MYARILTLVFLLAGQASGAAATDPCLTSANSLLGPPIADGALRADRTLFETLDGIFAHFGHAGFTLPEAVSALGINRNRLSLHLGRALVRGSLEMIADGVFAVPEGAVSASGQVGRDILEMASPLVTEFLANSVARLVKARDREALAGTFTTKVYEKNTSASPVIAKFELDLGRDLGLIEARHKRDNKHAVFYRYVEGAKLPDALAEAAAAASVRLAAVVPGISEADANLFSFLDEALRLFGHRAFFPSRAASRLGRKQNTVNHHLNRALARGGVEMAKNGRFRILPEAVSSSGEVGRRRAGISSRFVTERIVNSATHLIEARSSPELTEPFSARAYKYRANSPTTPGRAYLDLILGSDMGLIEAAGVGDDGDVLYRYVEGAKLPEVLAEKVRFASARNALLASGATPEDAALFASMDELYRLVGLGEFSLEQPIATAHFEQSSLTRYLSRALARGSVEATQEGRFRIRPVAVSSSGEVGRANLGTSSGFVTTHMVNSVASLITARPSGASTAPFARADYGRRRLLPENDGTVLAYELALGGDLGLMEARGISDDGGALYRYVEDAKLPEVLAEKVRLASERFASIALGATQEDAALFAAMDEALRLFGHRGFSIGQLVERSPLNMFSAVYLLDRALARGILDMAEDYTFSIPEGAVSAPGRVSREIRRFSSRFVKRSLVKSVVRLLEARDSGGFPGAFAKKAYTERSPKKRRAAEELKVGEDLGLIERVDDDPDAKQKSYRFRHGVRLPPVVARAVRKARGS